MAVYSPSPADGALRQGEIVSDLVEILVNVESLRAEAPNDIESAEQRHPFALVLTQDCDLDWDFKLRSGVAGIERHKEIPSILLCQMLPADELRGTLALNAGVWKRAVRNNDERFHILPSVPPDQDAGQTGLPSLAIDFKRIFAMQTAELYYRLGIGTRRRAFLQPPYLNDLAQRFANYYSRVALPDTAAATATALDEPGTNV